MKRIIFLFGFAIFFISYTFGQPQFPAHFQVEISLKTPGNPTQNYQLEPVESANPNFEFELKASKQLPLRIFAAFAEKDAGKTQIRMLVQACDEVNFQLRQQIVTENITHKNALFLMPGFWYRRNLRSPDSAPSMRLSENWIVREDRLSSPLCGVFDPQTGAFARILRTDKLQNDALMPYNQGEIILFKKTDIGGTGFANKDGKATLNFTFPFSEKPFSYRRKLTLAPPVSAYAHLQKGDEKHLSWQLTQGKTQDFSAFVKQTWLYTYNFFAPKPLKNRRSNTQIKTVLSKFFSQSFTKKYELNGFSGVHLHIDQCEKRAMLEVGFVGRVLLNAFNALEYGYETRNEEMKKIAYAVFDSYLKNGFSPKGFLREWIDFRAGKQTETWSIRRQSEGLLAVLLFLKIEKKHSKTHPEWENKVKNMLSQILKMQRNDFSFPRKFNDRALVLDPSGGSSSTVVPALVLAYDYFGNKKYLKAAQNTARYIEKEIVSKADYFSSTLDANCEDKEASLYAASAFYYLWQVSDKAERSRYVKLAEQSTYFALSWYYLWDVPFAKGQMLGDLGLKTRGWGNVSVENNHIDVYVFDFADVLHWLSEQTGQTHFAAFAEVIRSSMKDQLLPVEGRMCGIAKQGYYPEVVQHTNWDYGHNGKGYYNDLFAPGWVISSLWELLSPGRAEKYLKQ